MSTFLEKSDQDHSLTAKAPELMAILASLFAILDALVPTTMLDSPRGCTCLSNLVGWHNHFLAICISFLIMLFGNLALYSALGTCARTAGGGKSLSAGCGVRGHGKWIFSEGPNRSSKSSCVGWLSGTGSMERMEDGDV